MRPLNALAPPPHGCHPHEQWRCHPPGEMSPPPTLTCHPALMCPLTEMSAPSDLSPLWPMCHPPCSPRCTAMVAAKYLCLWAQISCCCFVFQAQEGSIKRTCFDFVCFVQMKQPGGNLEKKKNTWNRGVIPLGGFLKTPHWFLRARTGTQKQTYGFGRTMTSQWLQ